MIKNCVGDAVKPLTPVSSIQHSFDIDRMMSENELILAFRDYISKDSVQQLLTLTELKLLQTGEQKKLRKRVFNILVECLQNIVKHSADTDDEENIPSILLLGKTNEDFLIITGNKIENKSIPSFEAKIAEVNSWDINSIREIYSEKLGKAEYSDKGGAGLGLLDIYKRSGKKLEYEIHPMDDRVSFLSLQIRVPLE